jgi:Protein of unknown function (DUF1800)/Bacterial Ig domain
MQKRKNFSDRTCCILRMSTAYRLAAALAISLPINMAMAAVNLPPTATPATVTTNEDSKLTIRLAGTDPENKSLTYSLVSQPAKGAVNIVGNTAYYQPASNYNNTPQTPDNFLFKVNDGVLDSEPATVGVVVTPVNDRPVAQALNITTNKNMLTDIALVGTDVDGDALTYAFNAGSLQGGKITLKANNVVTYNPKYNYVGADSFTYKVTDPGGLGAPWVTVSLNILNNTAPVANAGSDQQVSEGSSVTLNGGGTDVDGDTLTYSWQQTAGAVTVNLVGANTATPSFTAPAINAYTTLTFTLTVSDGRGGTGKDSVDINVQDIMGRNEAGRFLEMATFGPTPTSIPALQSSGIPAWLSQQTSMPESTLADGLDINQVLDKVFLNMANGSDQLRQRMMFALSQTVVVSSRKNNNGFELIPWVRLLSRNAFGNYRTLLYEMTLSPTMGKYLDLANSRKLTTSSAPNENYPRELLQLFTIGLWELNQDGSLKKDANGQPIPTYNQQDIAEYSRALTGWTYPTQPGVAAATRNPEYFVGPMEFRTENHDTGSKTLLKGQVLPAGQSPELDLNAVLDGIFNHPNLPPFIATRLIRSLVTSNPSPDYIRRVADVFVNNGQGVRGDLKAVLTAILMDAEAVGTPTVVQGHLKDPILHILGFGRALGAQITDPSVFQYEFAKLNQKVLTPPTVFSFYSPLSLLPKNPALYAPEFQIYPPSQALERANVIYKILKGDFNTAFKIDLTPYTDVAGDSATLVEKVNQGLLEGRMSPQLKQIILTATDAIVSTNTQQRALGAIFLTAVSSEYSVQR